MHLNFKTKKFFLNWGLICFKGDVTCLARRKTFRGGRDPNPAWEPWSKTKLPKHTTKTTSL